MIRYVIRYTDRFGNGWSRFVESTDVRSAVAEALRDPDVHRVVAALPRG